MSLRRSRNRTDAIDAEGRALESFLWFAREHRDVYRLIDEAEFVEPRAYREHYETTASRIAARLGAARERGEVRRTIRTRSWRYWHGR